MNEYPNNNFLGNNPDIKAELENRLREETKAGRLAKWLHHNSTRIASVLAALFIFSVFFLINPEMTANGIKSLFGVFGTVHGALASTRYNFYQLGGLIGFMVFMYLMTVESTKARTIKIISARNPEQIMYVRNRPLLGIKLPFFPESKKVRSKVIETDYGYIVYPSKSMFSARWNGEKHFIPKHTKLSFGNTWVVAGMVPDAPTRIEIMETARGSVNVGFFDWTVDNLGNTLAERSAKEIETLRETIKTIEEQVNRGWQYARQIADQPQEFFDTIRESERVRILETIDKVGSGVFKEISQTIRQTNKLVASAEQRGKGRKEDDI